MDIYFILWVSVLVLHPLSCFSNCIIFGGLFQVALSLCHAPIILFLSISLLSYKMPQAHLVYSLPQS